MAGISFSGITQLFTAGTRPPHLAAIAPMSVTDDLYSATGVPRRHLQLGLRRRLDPGAHGRRAARARRRPAVGQGAREGGRQALHRQPAAAAADARRARSCIKRNPYRTPSLFDERSPGTWIKHISVPTFLVGQFQDEQTGGHFAEALGDLAKQPARLDHRCRTACTPTRSGRRRSRAGSSSSSSTSPTRSRSSRSRCSSLSGALYKYLADAGATPGRAVALRRDDRRRRRQGDLREGPARAAADGQRRRAGRASARSAPRGSSASTRGRRARRRRRRSTSAPDGALARHAPADAAERRTSPIPPRGRSRRCPATARPTRGRPSRRTTGRRSRPARALGFTTAPLAADVVIAGSSSLDLQLRRRARTPTFR